SARRGAGQARAAPAATAPVRSGRPRREWRQGARRAGRRQEGRAMTAQVPLHAFWPDAEPDPGAERLRLRTRRAYLLIAALVLGFFGLSAILQVGGAVVGSGEVAVESNVKTLIHPTGGILKALMVRDGDHVAKGQLLMRLDQGVSSVGAE